jgi:hypothetical protein
MRELPMAASQRHDAPAVGIEEVEDLADFHASDRRSAASGFPASLQDTSR